MRGLVWAVCFGLAACECGALPTIDGGVPQVDAGRDDGGLDAGIDAGRRGDCSSDCDCRLDWRTGCVNGRCERVGRPLLCSTGVLKDAGADGGPCGPSTCPNGCCDSSGECQPGWRARACGVNGVQCDDCASDGGLGWCEYGQRCGVGCFAQPVPSGHPPEWEWEKEYCPDAGCPSGSVCLAGTGNFTPLSWGCVPVPAACAGTPSCACMGCVCAAGCIDTFRGLTCDDTAISRRELKDDVRYLDEEARSALARQTLQIPLARYRYKDEPASARRRLGFLIDDQPNPSPAVMEDRLHVDEYGYTSMLLVTVQQQAREIAELQKRLEALERRCR